MATFNDAAADAKSLKKLTALLNVGRELEPRYGPMCLWFLAQIALHEQSKDYIGREALALAAEPCTRATAYGMLVLLEDDGLIERFQDPKDYKRKPMRTTERGRDALNRAIAAGEI